VLSVCEADEVAYANEQVLVLTFHRAGEKNGETVGDVRGFSVFLFVLFH
jgi:hypothetical protein